VQRRLALACAFTVLLSGLVGGSVSQGLREADRLGSEIRHWSSLLAADTRTDPLWLDAKKSAQDVLAQAEKELEQGRRLVALERLVAVGQTLGAGLYVSERPAEEKKELAAFEAEWKRMGAVLRDVVSANGEAAVSTADVRPALNRALAELSASQAREFYHASLEYGRNTEPQFGLYYLGAAQAQRRFLDIAHALPAKSVSRPPQFRTLAGEIDALQADLLRAYRPPASIDRHPEFIVASSALKEAREQDAAGHRFAAMLRYLQAAQRTAMLEQATSVDMAGVKRRLEEATARLAAKGTDHTIGQFFVERANSALATPGAPGEATAAAIALDVLPRYWAALEPARPAAPAAAPRVTVTLVRWPFT
jgi:hypothetical protein